MFVVDIEVAEKDSLVVQQANRLYVEDRLPPKTSQRDDERLQAQSSHVQGNIPTIRPTFDP